MFTAKEGRANKDFPVTPRRPVRAIALSSYGKYVESAAFPKCTIRDGGRALEVEFAAAYGREVLQLPLGIVERIAERKVNIVMSCAIDVKAVGMDVRAGHRQVNLHPIRRAGVPARAIRPLDRHMTVRDPLVETRQMMA
jgi:hypothetical protein